MRLSGVQVRSVVRTLAGTIPGNDPLPGKPAPYRVIPVVGSTLVNRRGTISAIHNSSGVLVNVQLQDTGTLETIVNVNLPPGAVLNMYDLPFSGGLQAAVTSAGVFVYGMA